MTKSELSVIIKELYKKYPQEFDSMNKSEKVRYANELYDTVGKYDAQLVMSAILRIFNRNYPKTPNKQQLLMYISRMLFERASEVFCKMHKFGYFRQNLSGSDEEIKKREYELFMQVSEDFIRYTLSPRWKKEIIEAPNKYDYVSEFKGLILFDDTLPIPPGCGPNAKC